MGVTYFRTASYIVERFTLVEVPGSSGAIIGNPPPAAQKTVKMLVGTSVLEQVPSSPPPLETATRPVPIRSIIGGVAGGLGVISIIIAALFFTRLWIVRRKTRMARKKKALTPTPIVQALGERLYPLGERERLEREMEDTRKRRRQLQSDFANQSERPGRGAGRTNPELIRLQQYIQACNARIQVLEMERQKYVLEGLLPPAYVPSNIPQNMNGGAQ